MCFYQTNKQTKKQHIYGYWMFMKTLIAPFQKLVTVLVAREKKKKKKYN